MKSVKPKTGHHEFQYKELKTKCKGSGKPQLQTAEIITTSHEFTHPKSLTPKPSFMSPSTFRPQDISSSSSSHSSFNILDHSTSSSSVVSSHVQTPSSSSSHGSFHIKDQSTSTSHEHSSSATSSCNLESVPQSTPSRRQRAKKLRKGRRKAKPKNTGARKQPGRKSKKGK
nr:cell wall integrity and stress response component 1-like [Procambarus clarkii]